MTNLFIIGLTGSIGCGKSTVTRFLGEMGALTLEADQLARDVLAPGTPGLQAVVNRFGADLLTEEQHLNRRLLAERAFATPQARQDLEAIVHPFVFQNMAAMLTQWERLPITHAVVVLEIPLLMETHSEALCDQIVVVTCGEAQWSRLQTRVGMSDVSKKNIIAQQLREEEKCQRAHWIIDNSGEQDDTIRQTQLLWQKIHQIGGNTQKIGAWPVQWQPFLLPTP
ncbi:MAG: dephospho-CoA kinase [Magnetococcales bacterium]|nr:dephospho-CoA kinase [Magnetococcales bacterium]MBF0439317.1 dephospho-CoA kinase [Magnetococcales bacterium]